ncbi:DUF4382 domain-containing protein [Winogradskyella ouciana]|uniref:DUF4382 domain-containing protein n=1 Tax=Winogradskyella ouciana TaxID=2608631 RepID=A0A7K1GCH3_9FLAO|nr:DUF4382 domain-containing protein [Winogradskyella ouciana]MTE26987.1 DUF4382 domain-containing protein [Winogradskyella ouciana]
MKYLKQTLLLLIAIFTFSCNNSDESSNDGTARLSVKLVDEPGDYEHVFIEVVDVMVKYDGESDDDENGWQSIGIINPGVYDLLELTGGVSLELVDNEEIEAGLLKQIRLVLGDDNSVVLEGETEPRHLNTPSAQQSGLKIMVNQEIVAGLNYDFILDFDADESIVMAGNSGNINLKPVLRASLEVNSGSLSGTVLPADVVVAVEATNGIETASTLTDDSGNFQILGLSPGVYTVTITPDNDSMLNAVIIEDVEIVIGETTNLGTITLE